MSTPTFDPEDPRLTAYALGETLSSADQAEVETLLQQSPEARAAVQEIKAFTLVLTAEYDEERRFSTEPAHPLTPNIIALASHLPTERRTWVRPLLAAAAMLLAVAALASLMPTFSDIQRRRAVAQSDIVLPQTKSARTEADPDPRVGGAMQAPDTATGKINEPFATPAESIDEMRAKLEADRAKLAMLDKKMTQLRSNLPSMRVDSVAEAVRTKEESVPSSMMLGSIPTGLAGKKQAQEEPTLANLPATPTDISKDMEDAPALAAPASVPGLALTQPAQGEVQRYAGKPATTSLSPIFEAPPAAPASQAADSRLVARASLPASAKRAEAIGMGQVVSATPHAARGESFKYPVQLQPPQTVGGSAVTAAPITPEMMGKAKFFITANSSGPEVTLYNTPRVAMKELSTTDTVSIQNRALTTPEFNTAAYDHLTENTFLVAKDNPLSTFSIDVDTASYANVRRFIEGGSLPPPDAVRLEELINYFPYDYAPPTPESGKAFATHLEVAACPWAPEHRLVRIGIKGREVATDKRPASNLVFLIDVSGSMEPPERLPLIKRAMSMMVEHLTENDRVAIVTYAGNSGLALPSTAGDHKDAILNALDHLEAGGSTNGASGITLAYKVAKQNFIKGGTNRVILATDGDFNVGVTSQGDLIRLIQDEAKSGVFLSALGVGTDNYKDSTMQKLADKGNGNYNYIDRLEEARKVLVEQMSGTLLTIAKDVKIQVEFNPAVVAAYRLIGYEKRMLRKEDFNDDKIDAGEIGAGHSVTALYEVVPLGQPLPGASPSVDALKYGAPVLDAAAKPEDGKVADVDAAKKTEASPEMLTVKMRHKAPDAEASERSYEEALIDHGTPDDFAKASVDFRFAAAVADFGLVLRDSPYKGNATLGAASEMAQGGKGADAKGYRAEFIELIHRAQTLKDGQVESERPVR